jgi:hypothetical protein
MKKRMLCLLSVLLVGVLILSSCGCIKETKEEPKKAFGGKEMEIPSGWKVYENKEWGIRVAYPPKVEVVRSKTPGGMLDVDFKFENKELGDAFGISCKKIGKDFDLASYAARRSGADKEGLEDVTVGGKPGKMEKHKEYVVPGVPPDTCVWVFVVHKGRVFEFLFGGQESGPQKGIWEETGNRMLDTVEFF